MREAILVACLACTLLLDTSCKQDRAQRVAASFSSVSQPAQRRRFTSPARPPDPGMPVEEDYEDQARSSITAENVRTKLLEFEAEMAH